MWPGDHPRDGMRSAKASTTVALLGALVLALPMATAHTNHVEVDPQVVADDRVRVEVVYALVDAWVVVHEANASGGPGEPIGHVAYDSDDGFRTDVEVTVSPSNGSIDGRLVAAIHREADGEGFDPDDDPILRRFGEPVVASFAAAHGEAPVYLGAQTFSPQEVADGTVRVRRVSLADDGHLVLTADVSGSDPLGVVDLAAGTHRNVTVAVRRPEIADDETLRVEATIHGDDGDGSFGSGDRPVRVGGEAVTTTFAVTWPGPQPDGDGPPGDPSPIPGPTAPVATALLAAAAVAWDRDGPPS